MYPKTKDEWWQLVKDNWPDLNTILWRFLPMEGTEILQEDWSTIDTILAGGEGIRMSIEVQRLREAKEPLLLGYFQNAWGAAPDTHTIHDIPGWGILCDLLSEGYLLDEQKREEDGS